MQDMDLLIDYYNKLYYPMLATITFPFRISSVLCFYFELPKIS